MLIHYVWLWTGLSKIEVLHPNATGHAGYVWFGAFEVTAVIYVGY